MARLAALLKAVTAPPTMSRSRALGLSERMSAVTHLISSLEYLTTDCDRGPGGFNNWERTRATYQAYPKPVRKVLDAIAKPGATKAIHLARVGAAAALLAPIPRRGRVAAGALLTASSLATYPRHHYGSDGADQASFLVQSLTTLARARERDPRMVDACLWFISMESSFSYAVAGWAKMTSPTWRSGRAMPGVLRTVTYGDPKAWALIRRYPKSARALGAGVLALECGFPLVYAAKGRLAPLLVGSAGAFHLANARYMALGRFFWSFGAMHPAVLYTAGPRQRTSASGALELRDDATAYATLGALALTAAATLGVAHRRRKLVLRPRGNESSVTTRSGNTLTYRRYGDLGGELPPVVVEAGLGGPIDQWEWIVRGLARNREVITYRRAGYGSSVRHDERPFELDHAVEDLADLVERVAGDRPVVLIGHSLGGYLVWKAAARMPGRVAALGLVDPSHPAELQRSPRQAQGEQILTTVLTAAAVSVTLGLGPLLDEPDWVTCLSAAARRHLLAEFRDARLWTAGRREWNSAREEFHAYDGTLPAIDVPVAVFTAELTARRDKEQQELHDELAHAVPGSVRYQIDGVDHDRILAEHEAARQLVDHFERFLDEAGHPACRINGELADAEVDGDV